MKYENKKKEIKQQFQAYMTEEFLEKLIDLNPKYKYMPRSRVIVEMLNDYYWLLLRTRKMVKKGK